VNANNPYPKWLARRYEISLPDATGFFGGYLSNTLYHTTDEFELQGTIASTVVGFGPGPILAVFKLQLNIGFVDDEFFPTIISLDLTAKDPFSGPDFYLLCTWGNQLPPEHGLHFFAPAIALVPQPANYNPDAAGPPIIFPIPWGG
jgi:hypothetical protein